MADVEFMIKIFLKSPLKEHFDEISIAVFDDRSVLFYLQQSMINGIFSDFKFDFWNGFNFVCFKNPSEKKSKNKEKPKLK